MDQEGYDEEESSTGWFTTERNISASNVAGVSISNTESQTMMSSSRNQMSTREDL